MMARPKASRVKPWALWLEQHSSPTQHATCGSWQPGPACDTTQLAAQHSLWQGQMAVLESSHPCLFVLRPLIETAEGQRGRIYKGEGACHPCIMPGSQLLLIWHSVQLAN